MDAKSTVRDRCRGHEDEQQTGQQRVEHGCGIMTLEAQVQLQKIVTDVIGTPKSSVKNIVRNMAEDRRLVAEHGRGRGMSGANRTRACETDERASVLLPDVAAGRCGR